MIGALVAACAPTPAHSLVNQLRLATKLLSAYLMTTDSLLWHFLEAPCWPNSTMQVFGTSIIGLLFETRGFVHVNVPYMEVGSNKVVENDPDAHERPLDTSVQTTVTTFSLLQNY